MYIDPVFANTIWVSVPFLLSAIFVAHSWRWAWFLICMTATVGIGYYRQIIIPSDVPYLLSYLGIGLPVMTILSWVLYGELLRLQGGIRWPKGKSWSGLRAFFPFLCGALIGDLAAAALLAPQVKESKARARVVLSAMAGGLVSPVGDANILVLAQSIPNFLIFMIPMGLISLLVINPRPTDISISKASDRGLPIWLLLLPIAIYVLVPQNAPLILLEACILLAVFTGKRLKEIQVGQFVWFVMLTGMLAIATAGGLPEFIALGSENIVLNYAHELPLMLGAGGMLAGSVVDGTISAVFTQAFIDRALDLSDPRYHFALAGGFAMGGALPLIVGRCFKAALKKHMLILVIGLLYIWFIATWLYSAPV